MLEQQLLVHGIDAITLRSDGALLFTADPPVHVGSAGPWLTFEFAG